MARDTYAHPLVIGLGTSGMATLRFLLARGKAVRVSEDRPRQEIPADQLAFLREQGVHLECGAHTEEFFSKADLLIPSPGVPLDMEPIRRCQDRGVPVRGELDLAGDFGVPVIAVTGTNGKTTVTGLIGTLLEAAGKRVFVGGNIGRPLLDFFQDPDGYDLVVLELSSFQLDLAARFRPHIGLVLNLTPDHLDRHGSMDRYVDAKMNMLRYQCEEDYAIVGADCGAQDAMLVPRSHLYLFGESPECRARVAENRVVLDPGWGNGPEAYPLSGTALQAPVNRLNAAAAVLAARIVGCAPEAVQQGLAAFQPPEHRMTLVAEWNGVRFVNDSKATNVGAAVAALASCPGQVILIGGGRDKAGDFSQMRAAVAARVSHLLVMGEAATAMAKALGDVVQVEMVADMREAVALAFRLARKGDTVLLAPACASFDMFTDYQDRGRAFAQAVRHTLKRVNKRT